MRTIIIIIGSVLTGYIIGNLEDNKIEDILENILKKGDN